MFSSKKPYSAVTVAVENFTSEQWEEDDMSGIPDLVEVIKLQATGPTEAARAIRKKLKYGNIHRQIRALVLLDGLIQNAGSRFQRTFADEMLLERLRVCGTSDLSDPLVKAKCKELFRSWTQYKNIRGLEQIASLYKQLPQRKQALTQDKSKVLRETEENPFVADEDKEDEDPPAPAHGRHASLASAHGQSSSSPRAPAQPSFFNQPASAATTKKSKKDKKSGKKSKTFNLEAEKETIKDCIGQSSVASTNLLNALRLINREQEQISDNQAAVSHFENCKLLRRKILRYIQLVESEQWLGGLLDANDRLVTALMTFEQLDRAIDADSDSDDELAEQAHLYKLATDKGKENEGATHQLAGLSISPKSPALEKRPPQPARPIQAVQPPPEEDEDHFEEEDENDPFADRNAVQTPAVEKPEPRWREV